jgi:hypothetical protein
MPSKAVRREWLHAALSKYALLDAAPIGCKSACARNTAPMRPDAVSAPAHPRTRASLTH